jgi:hypothetical protein
MVAVRQFEGGSSNFRLLLARAIRYFPFTSPTFERAMLKITRIALPKEQLQKLTAGERSLFLLLGYASNQINALWKLVVVATNDGTKDR